MRGPAVGSETYFWYTCMCNEFSKGGPDTPDPPPLFNVVLFMTYIAALLGQDASVSNI